SPVNLRPRRSPPEGPQPKSERAFPPEPSLSSVGTVPPRGEAQWAKRKGWKVNVDDLGVLFLSELVGTAMLVLLGCGVVANVALAKTKRFGGGFLMVSIGWGLAVYAGV